MIGRHDITFLSEAASQATEGTIGLIRTFWQDAIVENAETGEVLSSDCVDIISLPAELLVYKNAAARDSWIVNGAIPENENLMVHILRGDNSITIVVDDPATAEMSRLVGDIQNHVYQDILWIRADAA